MRAEVILGFDPVPGEASGVLAVSETLHKTIRALAEARMGLDSVIRSGSVFEGRSGEPIVSIMLRISRRLLNLEDAVVETRTALELWRTGLDQRQSEVAEIVRAVAESAGQPDAEERRNRLLGQASDLGDQHQRAAADLAAAFETLSARAAETTRADNALVGDLDRALTALELAVEGWIETEGPELIKTAIALGEVAGLTTVISELVGIAALGRVPGEADGVSETIARSPGSHRLIRALRQQWLELAPETLPEATFATSQSAVASIVAGVQPTGSDAGGEEQDTIGSGG